MLLRIRLTLKERHYLTCSSLVDPEQSPWHTLYQNRNVSSFIVVVSLDPDTFDLLLKEFARHYVVKSGPGKRGRPPKLLLKHAVLGCLLHFYSAAVEPKTLCELFGVPPSTFSRVLANAETALESALEVMSLAVIQYPSKA